MRELQEKLFAQSREGTPERLLVVLQAMDAAGTVSYTHLDVYKRQFAP